MTKQFSVVQPEVDRLPKRWGVGRELPIITFHHLADELASLINNRATQNVPGPALNSRDPLIRIQEDCSSLNASYNA